ncbi:inositol phospholipid synthesis and fat-storage-inducing TM-domain-containing protein [Phycomyces blakesleeanus]|uniref:Inositol phospholipid synthesis and fat-storage-inducing TM-domain-containing protein n=1 Tax=Phycomyces blakesleeanus TaxID=4837 RepID=A0ABR3BAL6_PHYBL
MTQSFFGPSIIDRVFVATGGHCSSKIYKNGSDTIVAYDNIFQQSSCRRLGGNWTGGHDVSGHCVMLIHASLFLWEELSWVFWSVPTFQRIRSQGGLEWFSILSVFSLLGLWWWMVLMTSVYFHGHLELLSGCVFGILGWAFTYLYAFPSIPFIGMPPKSLASDENTSNSIPMERLSEPEEVDQSL